MGIEEKFSSSFGRRDQGPNRELARAITAVRDFEAVAEIFELLSKKSGTRLRNDAILTIAAISNESPDMLTSYVGELVGLLNSKVNRQIFGAMIGLSNLSALVPEQLLSHLGLILESMDDGTVVTRDHGFTILTQVYKVDRSEMLLPLILEQLMKAPPNQLGQYAEKFISVMDYDHRDQLAAVLEERLQELVSDTHKKRLSKNLKKLSGV